MSINLKKIILESIEYIMSKYLITLVFYLKFTFYLKQTTKIFSMKREVFLTQRRRF